MALALGEHQKFSKVMPKPGGPARSLDQQAAIEKPVRCKTIMRYQAAPRPRDRRPSWRQEGKGESISSDKSVYFFDFQ